MSTHTQTSTQSNKASLFDNFLEKSILLLNRDDTRKKMQVYLIDPLLNHIMERVFPYIVLTCVLFSLLLIVAMLTFGMLIVQNRPHKLWSLGSAAAVAASQLSQTPAFS